MTRDELLEQIIILGSAYVRGEDVDRDLLQKLLNKFYLPTQNPSTDLTKLL